MLLNYKLPCCHSLFCRKKVKTINAKPKDTTEPPAVNDAENHQLLDTSGDRATIDYDQKSYAYCQFESNRNSKELANPPKTQKLFSRQSYDFVDHNRAKSTDLTDVEVSNPYNHVLINNEVTEYDSTSHVKPRNEAKDPTYSHISDVIKTMENETVHICTCDQPMRKKEKKKRKKKKTNEESFQAEQEISFAMKPQASENQNDSYGMSPGEINNGEASFKTVSESGDHGTIIKDQMMKEAMLKNEEASETEAFLERKGLLPSNDGSLPQPKSETISLSDQPQDLADDDNTPIGKHDPGSPGTPLLLSDAEKQNEAATDTEVQNELSNDANEEELKKAHDEDKDRNYFILSPVDGDLQKNDDDESKLDSSSTDLHTVLPNSNPYLGIDFETDMIEYLKISTDIYNRENQKCDSDIDQNDMKEEYGGREEKEDEAEEKERKGSDDEEEEKDSTQSSGSGSDVVLCERSDSCNTPGMAINMLYEDVSIDNGKIFVGDVDVSKVCNIITEL